MKHKTTLIFQLGNVLNRDVLGHILEYLSMSELNLFASLKFHSESKSITNELFTQTLITEFNIGTCLIIYSWSDQIWKDLIQQKVDFINKLQILPNPFPTIPTHCRGMFL